MFFKTQNDLLLKQRREAVREERQRELRVANEMIRRHKWQMEQLERAAEAEQHQAYWDRRHEDDKTLWRDKVKYNMNKNWQRYFDLQSSFRAKFPVISA